MLSGGLMLLAFPPVDQGWVALVGLVPLCLALRGARGRAGFVLGFAFGLTFFGALVWWISYFGGLAWGALTLAQALYLALFGWFAAWASRAWIGRILAVPAIFVLFEIVRTRWPLGGFAWGGIGYTQHDGGPLLALARVGGVHLVTVAVVGLNALFAQFLTRSTVWRRGFALACATALALWPAAALEMGLAGSRVGELDVALVQGNVPRGAFAGGVGDRLGRTGPEDLTIVANHVDATLPLASAPPELVVWPENALDRDPITNAEVGQTVLETVQTVDTHFIVGAILDAENGRFRNANLLYAPDGTIASRYDKLHLVPFGEYVPWEFLRTRIPALRDEVPADGVPGKRPVVFSVGDARVAAVICFESTYPTLVRQFVSKGAQVIVVSTNNASFRGSPAAAQHLAMSQLRAVEEGRPVLHAAISGITAFIDPQGRVEGETRLFTQAVVRRTVPLVSGRTPYSSRGDMIELFMVEGGGLALLVTVLGLTATRARRRERIAEQEMWGGEDSLRRVVTLEPRGFPGPIPTAPTKPDVPVPGGEDPPA